MAKLVYWCFCTKKMRNRNVCFFLLPSCTDLIHTLVHFFRTLYKTDIALQNYMPFEIIKLHDRKVDLLMFLSRKSCVIAMSAFLIFLRRCIYPIQTLAHFFGTLYQAEIPKYLHSRYRVTKYLPFQIIKLCDGKVGLLVLLRKKDA